MEIVWLVGLIPAALIVVLIIIEENWFFREPVASMGMGVVGVLLWPLALPVMVTYFVCQRDRPETG